MQRFLAAKTPPVSAPDVAAVGCREGGGKNSVGAALPGYLTLDRAPAGPRLSVLAISCPRKKALSPSRRATSRASASLTVGGCRDKSRQVVGHACDGDPARSTP